MPTDRPAVVNTPPRGWACPKCGRVSYHPTDAEQGYCGACHQQTAGELLNGCPVEMWDGLYLIRCGLGVDVCAHHGPFERARRCFQTEGCTRPEGHWGSCC